MTLLNIPGTTGFKLTNANESAVRAKSSEAWILWGPNSWSCSPNGCSDGALNLRDLVYILKGIRSQTYEFWLETICTTSVMSACDMQRTLRKVVE